jgi:hypothetical protein
METRSAVLLALAAYLFVLTSIGRVLKLVLFLAVWLPWGGTHYVHFVRNTYKRDWRFEASSFSSSFAARAQKSFIPQVNKLLVAINSLLSAACCTLQYIKYENKLIGFC